jgi:hypothetical protein
LYGRGRRRRSIAERRQRIEPLGVQPDAARSRFVESNR